MKESPACSKQAREAAIWTAGAGSQKQPPSGPHWSHEESCPWGFGGHPRASGQAPILEAALPHGNHKKSPRDTRRPHGPALPPRSADESRGRAGPQAKPDLRPTSPQPRSSGPGTNLPPGFAGSILEQVILYYCYLISTYFRVCQLSLWGF